MILPIRAFGDGVLRKMCKPIDSDYPDLGLLVENMMETMDASNGVGLSSPANWKRYSVVCYRQHAHVRR